MTEQQAINKLVNWCNGEVGYKEGANNWNKYSDNADVIKLLGWRPQNQAWCDTFTDYAFIINFGLDAASKMTYQPIGKGSAACRYSAQFFKDNNAFFYRNPQVGDVIFFISAGAINHQGIVTGVSGLSVTTVEGNSSDAVSRRVYTVNDTKIAGYGRPKWSVVANVPDTPASSAPAEKPSNPEIPVVPSVKTTEDIPMVKYGNTGKTVRAAQILLIGLGYSCGSYGADGDFGGATLSAVEKFQRAHGLDADGVIGPQTWAALLGL